MKILLVPNFYKTEALEGARMLERWLDAQGCSVAWAADQRSGLKTAADVPEGADLVISLGGDGTLLRAVRIVRDREIPILGLSYGHIGFLTAADSKDDILQVVSNALAGEMHVSRRATLDCEVCSVNSEGKSCHTSASGLNDMALTRSGHSDIIEFDVCVSGHKIDRLRADGVVVATATGSTAYALSAGGPIVSPDYTGLVCVPIAPHTIQARAFLTSPSDVVEISMSSHRKASPTIALDGQYLELDGYVQQVRVRRGAHDVLLLDFGPESFYASVSRVFYGVRHDDAIPVSAQ